MLEVLDLGRLDYRSAWERQLVVADQVLAGGADTLIFVEHPPVLTLGANFHQANLLHPREWYLERGIEVLGTDRGGDVTFHGPGQLVIYPIFDIARHGRDLHKWIRDLEGAILRVLEGLGISGRRFAPYTGVWVGDLKVAAIGIKVRRWVSLHGIALNCNNDLSVFESFVPCGIQGYGVTSLSELIGRDLGIEEVKPLVLEAFRAQFYGN